MQIEKYTDRLKSLIQAAQTLAMRSGHQQLRRLPGIAGRLLDDRAQLGQGRQAR